MKKLLYFFPSFSAIFMVATFGFGQSGEISIQFIGNCGLYLTDGTQNIYVDFPYKSGAYNYMEYDTSELDKIAENSTFIFTHRHADHYSEKILKKILKTKNGNAYGSWNIEALENLGTTIPHFSIETFETKHRFSFSHYSYLITWHGKKIYFSGDTETAETIKNVTEIDWAFVPYWILMDAKEKNISLDLKMVGVYHLYPNQKVSGQIPEKIKLLNVQGEVITIQY